MMIMFVSYADPGDDDDIGIDLDSDRTTVLSKLIIVGCVYICSWFISYSRKI